MPIVLVTGANGFTGRYLVARLRDAGHQVFGLAGLEDGSGAEAVACDLTDRAAVATVIRNIQPSWVAHLAAISFVGVEDIEKLYTTNVIGTRNLLEALAGNPVRPTSVLIASSANVYGNAAVDPIVESTIPVPENDYAVSKLAMEHMARLWMDKLPIVITRPFNYTGVGQSLTFLLPKIVDHFRRGVSEIELGNLDVERDFSDVRTVVDAYVRLLSLPIRDQTFNICSGRSTSLGEVLHMIGRIAGYTIRTNVNPALVRDREVRRLRGSNAKLVTTIGELNSIPLEETLRWMFSATGSQ